MSRLSWYIWIRGQRWWFSLTQPHQLEDGDPDVDTLGDSNHWKKRIRVSLGLEPKEFLYTVIHEVLHGCLPDYDETAIVESSRSVTNAIWKLNFIWNPAWRRDARKEKPRRS